MALQVICAGLGRTGTASIKVALEQLGLERCYHMGEVMSTPGATDLWVDAANGNPDWETIFDGYEAATDFPACAFWRELADYFPEARIVLSARDPEKWFESVRETIFSPETLDFLLGTPFREFFEKAVWRDFGSQIHDGDFMVSYFSEHCSKVEAAFPKDRLLRYEVRQGWDPLCQFLALPVPETPFPHVNSRDEFAQMFERMKAHQSDHDQQRIGKLAGEMYVDRKDA